MFEYLRHYFCTCEHYTTKIPIHVVVYRNNNNNNNTKGSITFLLYFSSFLRNGTNNLFNFVQIHTHTHYRQFSWQTFHREIECVLCNSIPNGIHRRKTNITLRVIFLGVIERVCGVCVCTHLFL